MNKEINIIHMALDPNDCIGNAEIGCFGQEFYFRGKKTNEWVRMKRMTITPERIIVAHDLLVQDKAKTHNVW